MLTFHKTEPLSESRHPIRKYASIGRNELPELIQKTVSIAIPRKKAASFQKGAEADCP